MYGLGVRIGFYIQALAMILYTHGRRNGNGPGKGLKLASGSISIALLSAWFVSAARASFSPSEAAIVLLILLTISVPGKLTLMSIYTIPGEAIGLVSLLLFEIAFRAAQLWLFANLVITLPHLGTENIIFLFVPVRIDGWFRWVALAYCSIAAILLFGFVYTVILIALLTLRKESDGDDNAYMARIESILGVKEVPFRVKCLHFINLVVVVVAIELTIKWDHLVPSTNLQSPGQLIPLVTGILICIDGCYVAAKAQFPSFFTKAALALGGSLNAPYYAHTWARYW
jgi:hypothetical protein